jgi:hypothetical protein
MIRTNPSQSFPPSLPTQHRISFEFFESAQIGWTRPALLQFALSQLDESGAFAAMVRTALDWDVIPQNLLADWSCGMYAWQHGGRKRPELVA